MKSKTLWSALAGCALLTLMSVSAWAQVGRLEGDVVKEGSKEPIVGAEVVIERTDIKGTYPVKTDKKGHFLHAGVPLTGTYTVLVSAPGCEPTFLSGIRVINNNEPLKIELRAGDGRKLTMEDVKKAGGVAKAGPGGAPAPPKMSEEEMKKAKEEYEQAKKDRDEAEKYNAAIGQINVFLKAGNDMLTKNDLNGAIGQFQEAVKLNPDIHISQGNLAIALQKRGVGQFNAGNRDAAKQDFLDSIAATQKALSGLESQEKDTKMTNDPLQNRRTRTTYHVVRAESEAILATKFGDLTQVDAAVKDYTLLAELTDDPAKKKDYPLKAAKVYFDAGKSEEAVTAYNKILESDPENVEALYNLGLAYAGVGKFQESANTLQKFVDKAPATDQRVAEAKSVIKDLIVGNNLQPPKSEPTKGKGAPAKKKP